MAKTDAFFIRAQVTSNSANFTEASIDLGAFVDALGKSVLRIHSISAQITDETSAGQQLILTAGTSEQLCWQLTTQSQSAMLTFEDKSVVAGAVYNIANTSTAAGLTDFVEIGDRVDQQWSKGYLVGVEQMYLGCEGGGVDLSSGNVNFTLIMECTVETLTANAAMALSLSQQ